MEQQTLAFTSKAFKNVRLFSDHFLVHRLPRERIWLDVKERNLKRAHQKALNIYKTFKQTYKSPNEDQTEDEFIKPILEEVLGFETVPKPRHKLRGRYRWPDYSLFFDKKTKQQATPYLKKEQERFFNKALSICEAKYWGRTLDFARRADQRDLFEREDPSTQIVAYLERTAVDWGVLTNGKLWRLYYRGARSRLTNYLEVDLEKLLGQYEPETFKYFYLFFSKKAFARVADRCFLDDVYDGSITYGSELSDRLRDIIFDEIFEHLAAGFIAYRRKVLEIKEEKEKSLNDIYNATLTLLYRMLFVLYAEAQDLLPISDEGYARYSFEKIKRRAKEDEEGGAILSRVSTDLWNDMDGLFQILDHGDPSLNMPEYNGGLFGREGESYEFLKQNKVPDYWLVDAIYKLTVEPNPDGGEGRFYDYQDLGTRHLGSVYEGLLEYKLEFAKEDLAVIKEKKEEKYIPLAEAKKKLRKVINKGHIYLVNDRRHRKSTGSYFTPQYIVQYIIHQTVGPILEERFAHARELLEEREEFIARLQRASSTKTIRRLKQNLSDLDDQITEKLLTVRVLDPAIGSGHFLVEALDFITDKVATFLEEYPDNPISEAVAQSRSAVLEELKEQDITVDVERLTDANLLKRLVMKRCIYGADLNPMAVELAKVSLWLDSFTLGAPLSFLDHHLKCGNSLIGAEVEGVREAVEAEKQLALFGSQFIGLLNATELMRRVGELSDVTTAQVRESRVEYCKAYDVLAPFRHVLDLYTSQWFGNELENLLEFLRAKEAEAWVNNPTEVSAKLNDDQKALVKAAQAATKEHRFFHWDLAFPEVFYGPRAGTTQLIEKKENPGFDAVVGNPPYQLLQGTDLQESMRKINPDIFSGSNDISHFFMKKALQLTLDKL